MKRYQALGFRIAALIDLLVFAIICSLGLTIDGRLRMVLGALITQQNLQIVQARADEIGRLVGSYKKSLRQLAAQAAVFQKSERDVEDFVASMRDVVDDSADLANVYVFWPDGRLRAGSGAYVNVSDRDYFKAIFDKGEAEGMSAPLVSRVTGKPSIILASPVKAGGAVRCAVAYELSLANWSSITAKIKAGRTGYGWATDNKGLVIAFPKPEVIMKLDISVADEKNGYRGLDALARELLSKETTTGRFVRNDKVPMSLFAAAIPATAGWRLGVNVPTAEIYAPVAALDAIVAAAVIVGLLIMGVVSSLTGHWIAKPIRGIAGSLRNLAEGEADLTKRLGIRRSDEIGELAASFDLFLSKLRDIVVGMRDVQVEMAHLGGDLDGGVEKTVSEAKRIEDQIAAVRAQIEGQARSVEDVSSAVAQNAIGVERLDRHVAGQSASIVEVSASIEEMVGNIGSMTLAIERIAVEFAALSVSSERGRSTQRIARERIASISEQSAGLAEANEAIGSIAQQTNLLAMNAAIEAAHAGETGKGFSVVADEIRRLAETAAEQSKTIGATLKSIEESIGGIVEAAAESESAFDDLAAKVGITDSLVAQLKTAMGEQKDGSTQVLEAIRDMNEANSQVMTSSTEMNEGNKVVSAEMGRLRTSSSEIGLSAGRIAEDATGILGGAKTITTLAERNGDSVKRMDKAIGRFKI